MVFAKIYVTGTCARVTELKKLTSGLVGGKILVDYDDHIWAGLSKAVVFQGIGEKDALPDECTVEIPWEVVEKPCKHLWVGFYGTDSYKNMIIPTVYADLGPVLPGADPSGDESTDPSLPVWAQLQNQIDALANKPDSPGGPPSVVELDTTLTQSGKAADAKSVGDAIARVSGGNVELDTTLTEEGKAADAKAVGDAISTLSDEIAALKGETTTIVPVSEYLKGGYIRADGTLNTSTASLSVYGPIALKVGDKVSFTAAGIVNGSAILARANGNADKPYDVVLTSTVIEEAEYFEYEVTVSGDYYISSIRKYATVTECSVTTGSEEVSGGEVTTNELSVSEYLNGGYIRADGTLNSSTAAFSVYGPIALKTGDTIRFNAAGSSTAVAILALATGIEDKPYNTVITSTDADAHEFVYTATADGDYYISSVRSKATVSSVLVTTGQADSEDENYLSEYRYAVSKILCIGDSLTNGAYYAGGANGAPITQNYPYYLGRMLNCETTNAGNNGDSASDWYNRNISEHTYTNYDTVIIWLGTNYGCTAMPTDAEISSFTPDSNATAENANQALYLVEIIKTIQAENPFCHIVLCTIFESNTDVAANNDVVSQIADKYGCQLVDMSDLSVSNHIELHAGIKNVHFGKVGNIYIANRLANEIGSYIAADPLKGEFGITFR